LVVGPAGAGKTRTLATAVADPQGHGRHVLGLAPTAKAARVLERATAMPADTVAKLLHDWHQHEHQLGAFAMAPDGTWSWTRPA
jgi:ATP-dependent exoDNAse (exonuclease V) alpha subunit